MESSSRRTFLRTVTAGASLLGITARSYDRIVGANDRIGIGLVGAGRMGRGHLARVGRNPDTDLVAVCDVYRRNLEFAAERAPDARTYGRHEELLDDDRVDAVIVASPDHWHALHTVYACRAGKDVYVEKPASTTIAEGRAMVEAARDRVVQLGTQQRSGDHFARAADIVRSGGLGKVTFVRCWNVGNDAPDGMGAPPDGDPPEGLDWDRWLGPAPLVPFNVNRFGVVLDEGDWYLRWATFRHFWDYAGGMMTDWGVHHLDIVLWAMDSGSPETVSASGGKFVLTDNRETPDTLQAVFRFKDFVVTYENRVCSAHPLHDQGYGILFHGTKGTLYLNRAFFEILPEPGSDLNRMRVERSNDAGEAHLADFVGCVRSRRRPVSDIEIGHLSSATAILGNMAFRTGRTLRWDGSRESVVGDEEADAMVRRAYRSPWTL